MVRLYDNSKVKRVVAWLLTLGVVLTTFITSFTEPVYAATNSNSRRRTSINLAAGAGFGDIDDWNSIDARSMQTIAIYLSNFYLPFVTILDGDYSKEGAEDSGNNQHVQAMKDALVRNCGFKKDVADYLVGYALSQSLASCKAIYVKESQLRSAFNLTEYNTGKSYLGFSNGSVFGTGYAENHSTVTGFASIIDTSYFEFNGTWSSSAIYYTKEVVKPAGFLSSAEYGDWDYIRVAGTVEVGGVKYVPVSYSVFLGLMSDIYCSDYSGTDPRGSALSDSIGEVEFYTLLSGNETTGSALRMAPVFSNNENCRSMLLNALQYCDLENGFSTGFASISGTDVESINNPEATQYSLACAPNMYVNWEGSLVFDNGVYRTIVLPGCMNPYMVTEFSRSYESVRTTLSLDNERVTSSSLDAYTIKLSNGTLGVFFVGNGTQSDGPFSDFISGMFASVNEVDRTITFIDKVPSESQRAGNEDYQFINNTTLSSLGLGYTDSEYPLSFSSLAYPTYRVTIGANQSNFDQSWKPGSWGENQSIFDLLESMEYVSVNGITGNDYARFPILTATYDKDDFEHVSGNKRFIKYDTDSNSDCRFIVFYDSFTKVTADTKLNEFFKKQDVFDEDFIKLLEGYNLDTYAQFRNIKKQGHALSYPQSTQKLFQQIYLTYCFAAFNAESTSGYSDEENIVPMRLNFDDFPEGNVDISFESIQQDMLANEVMGFVYYLLHPTEGVAYVATWFKNKVSGILLSWHEDIVGATSSNAATGMTKYLGTSSYATMPNLKDISWVTGILNIYNNIVVYLIIMMCLILLCYVLTGSMTIQRGIVGVVLFGICAFLPPVAINGAVDLVNTTSDTIFSKKFDYWAICQLQNFVDDYVKAMEAQGSGDFSSYAAFVISSQKSDVSLAGSDDEASAASFSGAKVKWMAPKKYNSLASLVSAVNEGTAMGNSSASFLKNSLLSLVAKSTSGETYLDDSESLYLYRDYADIFKYAHSSYNIYSKFNYKGDLGTGTSTSWMVDKRPLWMGIESGSNSSYGRAWRGLEDSDVYKYLEGAVSTTLGAGTVTAETSAVDAVSKGYLYNTINYNFSGGTSTQHSYLSEHDETTKFTYAISYLANYNKTFREVHEGLTNLKKVVNGEPGYTVQVGNISSTNPLYNFGLPKAAKKESSVNGSYMLGYQEIIGLEDVELSQTDAESNITVYKDLSDIFYGLYSESPFYYFNAVARDQLNASNLGYTYSYPDLTGGKVETSDGNMNHVAKMFLKENQEYFFNLTPNAGDGFGELRDFTNMHDFFYFVIPYLREGVELARIYDDVFGLYTDADCSLIVNADGSIFYDGGDRLNDLDELGKKISEGSYTDEEKYKLWHTYNTYTILSAYTPWIDTMLDCDYSKAETITVLGERFRVSDPLNPRTYYEEDPNTHQLVAGRYMVFSKSEMNAMGMTTADLTSVERKIIQFQENVYNNTLNLMNYYTFSDEVLLQAYAMLQTFEFNKLFSQTSPIKESFVMYPQGYELKAFSYDAYLRMIVSGASGESLMFNGSDKQGGGNVSIYERVMKNTSLFFGIFLLINDILAVYLIPGLKIFFLVTIFFCSVLILVGSVIKMEMNILAVIWKSLLAPLLSFSAICIGLSLIVSMFMKNGADGVVSSEFTISVGDPTSAIILMIILNVLVVTLMWKVCKKCFRDLITYGKAVFDNIGSTVVGAVGGVVGGFTSGRAMDRFGKGSGGSGVSRTAKQRGRDNDPRSGRAGVGGALAAGIGGAALGAAAAGGGDGMAAGEKYDAMSARDKQRLHDTKNRSEDTVGMNKYDRKAYDGAAAKRDIAKDKLERDKVLASNATGLRKARFEMAQKLHQRQLDSATIKQDNVKKYGTGFKSKLEGAKAFVGPGRKSRLEGIKADNDKRIEAREQAAQAAVKKRDMERAKPMTDAMSRQTEAMTKQTRALKTATYSQKGSQGRRPAAAQRGGSSATAKGKGQAKARKPVSRDFTNKRAANQKRAASSRK